MKYLEELETGDSFQSNGDYYIVTTDFKKNRQKLCVDLKTGFCKWFKPEDGVENIDLFTFDKDSNMMPIKERKKEQS
jgi:hypothetical protein